MGSYSVSVSNTVKKRLKELEKKAPAMIEKALGPVALRMNRDFVLAEPAAPVLTGFLRGSTAVFVNDKKIAEGKDLGGKSGDAPQTNDMAEPKTVLAVINTPYAARLDQKLTPKGPLKLGPFSIQAGNVGGGFVSVKVASKKYQETWTKIFAKGINENFK